MKWAVHLLALLAAVAIHAPALSGEAKPGPAQPVAARQVPVYLAPVMLGGKVVLSVPGYHKLSAEERAKGISERLQKVAEDSTIPASSITSFETDVSSDIIAGDRIIMVVYDDDALPARMTRQLAAKGYVLKIRAAVEEYRRERTPKSIAEGVLAAGLATVALMTVAFISRRLYGRMRRAVEGRDQLSVKFQKFELLHSDQVRKLLLGAMRVARLAFMLVVLYLYVQFVLSSFPWTQPISGHLLQYLAVPVDTMKGAFVRYIPNLIFLVILACITYYVLKFLHLVADEVERETITFSGFYKEWAKPSYKIIRFVIIAFAAVVAFPYLPGSESPAFKGVSIFLGVLISLGSSSTVSNIIAGLDLTYRRAFLKGDWIKIGDITGHVLKMRLLVTHLRTFKNEEVVVPNAVLLNTNVVNYSSAARECGVIIHTAVTIGYGTPWRQVHAFLLQAAERTSGILRDPPPYILQTALDDFYVRYELNAYIDSPQEMPEIYSDLHMNIQDAFNEYEVQIMSPHYMFDPKPPAVVPKSRWYEPPAKPPAGEAPPPSKGEGGAGLEGEGI